ncbi:MAG: hypothetical protein WCP79_00255 [Bacillota bacterium]
MNEVDIKNKRIAILRKITGGDGNLVAIFLVIHLFAAFILVNCDLSGIYASEFGKIFIAAMSIFVPMIKGVELYSRYYTTPLVVAILQLVAILSCTATFFLEMQQLNLVYKEFRKRSNRKNGKFWLTLSVIVVAVFFADCVMNSDFGEPGSIITGRVLIEFENPAKFYLTSLFIFGPWYFSTGMILIIISNLRERYYKNKQKQARLLFRASRKKK